MVHKTSSRLIAINPKSLVCFTASFGLVAGACAGYSVYEPDGIHVYNAIIAGAQSGLICGLASYVLYRIPSRTFSLQDLIAATILVAVVVGSTLHWRQKQPSVSSIGPPGENAIVIDLKERRRITESRLESIAAEIRRDGRSRAASYRVSSSSQGATENWALQFAIRRESIEGDVLVCDLRVNNAGDGEHGTIEPIQVHSLLDTEESRVLLRELLATFDLLRWPYEIDQNTAELSR